MKSTDASKTMTSGQRSEDRKPYVAPGFKRLSAETAKELLLRSADTSDPEVRRMLDRIEVLLGEKGRP